MPHPVDVHVGNQLRIARLTTGLSQSEIARQVGISFQQIQKYETGSNRISASRLFEFSEILGVHACYFFEGLKTESKNVGIDIVKAIAAIKDEKVRVRVLTFISDVSGLTVSTGPSASLDES